MRRLICVLLIRALGAIIAMQASAQAQTSRLQYGPLPHDLANALVKMALASKTPLIAELAQPLPDVSIPEGLALSSEGLDRLLQQAPGYEWELQGKVIHVYSEHLRRAHFNFLNLEFAKFTIPPNLSDFKLWFPPRAIGLIEGYQGEGGAISGFSDSSLAKHTLHRVTLNNITPLAVLIHVANESPSFYSVLVFPNAQPSRTDAEKHVSWQWGSLDEPWKPIYVQPPPQRTKPPEQTRLYPKKPADSEPPNTEK